MLKRRYVDFALRMRASEITRRRTSLANRTRNSVSAAAMKAVSRGQNVQQTAKDAANAKE